ncbi:uncharacterized protein [Watersipora subatra]|uniref:uncharacterized protein n=1 Tax=Watersipora subatra TaxID=2589382 RepID=UPI00355C2DFB
MATMRDITAYDFKTDVAFPPGNFQIWPATRVGALTIDILLLITFLLLWFIPRKVYNTDGLVLNDEDDTPNGIVNQFKMWGFWVSGFDAVYVKEGQVTVVKRRGMGCCSEKVDQFPKESVVTLTLKKRKFFSLGIVWAFFISCLGGIWIHFIPCIWWTCDWGYFDGQGFRGGLWFTTWGILCFALILFYPIVELELTVRPNTNSQKTKVYTLAVAEGSARSIDDEVAIHDLQTLRELLGVQTDLEDENPA